MERSWARILKGPTGEPGQTGGPQYLWNNCVASWIVAPSKKKKKKTTLHRRDFSGGPVAKTPCLNAWDLGLIPRWGGSPGRRKWQPTPVFLPGESHGQRSSLAGYSLRDHRIRHDWRDWAHTQETRFFPLETHMLQLKKQDATTKTEDPTGCNEDPEEPNK